MGTVVYTIRCNAWECDWCTGNANTYFETIKTIKPECKGSFARPLVLFVTKYDTTGSAVALKMEHIILEKRNKINLNLEKCTGPWFSNESFVTCKEKCSHFHKQTVRSRFKPLLRQKIDVKCAITARFGSTTWSVPTLTHYVQQSITNMNDNQKDCMFQLINKVWEINECVYKELLKYVPPLKKLILCIEIIVTSPGIYFNEPVDNISDTWAPCGDHVVGYDCEDKSLLAVRIIRTIQHHISDALISWVNNKQLQRAGKGLINYVPTMTCCLTNNEEPKKNEHPVHATQTQFIYNDQKYISHCFCLLILSDIGTETKHESPTHFIIDGIVHLSPLFDKAYTTSEKYYSSLNTTALYGSLCAMVDFRSYTTKEKRICSHDHVNGVSISQLAGEDMSPLKTELECPDIYLKDASMLIKPLYWPNSVPQCNIDYEKVEKLANYDVRWLACLGGNCNQENLCFKRTEFLKKLKSEKYNTEWYTGYSTDNILYDTCVFIPRKTHIILCQQSK
jgi:hypothetical protein